MNPEIVPVPESDKAALWEMLQAYIAELSVYAGVEPVEGVYRYAPFERYWSEEGRFPFWAMVGDKRAGFALVWHDRGNGVFRMAEFYVAPQFRRTTIGGAFAHRVLRSFPGHWKIRQIARNTGAVAFWRKTLARYGYTEENFHDRGLERFEQSFVVG